MVFLVSPHTRYLLQMFSVTNFIRGEQDNWNIPCITCQHGWKQWVIYNNRLPKWCFYPCHLWLNLPVHSPFSLSDLQSDRRDSTNFILLFVFLSPSWPPKWTPFKKKKKAEMEHLELRVCLLWRFKRGPGVTFAFGSSSVQCSLGQTGESGGDRCALILPKV